jgi:uncharacterized protein (TIGR02466 family)
MHLLRVERTINYHDVSTETLFPSFIWSCSIDIDPDKIKQEVYRIKKNHLSVVASNSSAYENIEGGYHSPYFSPNPQYEMNYPCIFDMIKTSEKFINKLLNDHIRVDREVDKISFWALINKPYDYNMMHVHPHTDLIGVYYASLPKKSGNMVVIRDDSFSVTNLGVQFAREIFAEQGKLYVLPANLFHFVQPNLSGNERISIALNITVKNSKNAKSRPVFKVD